MILDYSRADENGKMGGLEQKYALGVVLVDGKEIKLVRYADTQAGFVVTFDVVPDGIVPARNYTASRFPRPGGGLSLGRSSSRDNSRQGRTVHARRMECPWNARRLNPRTSQA